MMCPSLCGKPHLPWPAATLGFVSLFVSLFATLRPNAASASDPDIVNRHGHLQAFGQSGYSREIQVREDFPSPFEFLTEYVSKSKPVKLAGVIRDSRAVRLWTDDYLLSLDVPPDNAVGLETKKKENRSQETTYMHFHEFLKIYNHTEHYMVDDVPAFLRPDVTLPCSLQCRELVDQGLAFANMWFSSGGTKSVVHTDSFDNINCLLRGQKSFVMMDPARDREKIDLAQNGAYSVVDVDSVDLTKFPGLAESEFYHINLTAGDCLFIPYRWIHQVRSFNSNVAINFWWDHYNALELLKADGRVCRGAKCDPSLTLDHIKLHGHEGSYDNMGTLKDWLFDLVVSHPVTKEGLIEIFSEDFDPDDIPEPVGEIANEVFELLDADKDGLYTVIDFKEVSDEAWDEIKELLNELTTLVEDAEDDEDEEHVKDEL